MLCGDETGAVVVDYGSYNLRVGFAGEEVPKVVKNTFSEPYAYSAEGLKNTKNVKFEGLNKLVEDSAALLSTDLAQCPIILPVPDELDVKVREKILENAFEKYNVPALYLAPSSMLASFSQGKQSALVCDLGYSEARFTPVVDGFLLKSRARKHDQAGRVFTENVLAKNPELESMDLKQSLLFAEDLKKNFYSVPESGDADGDESMSECKSDGSDADVEEYVLPDKTKIGPIKIKRSTIFQVSLAKTYSKTIYDLIKSLDVNLRKELGNNILFCGGTSCSSGMCERIFWELNESVDKRYKIKYLRSKPEQRLYSTWVGASVLASLGNFQQVWISKKEVKDFGARNVLMMKCPV